MKFFKLMEKMGTALDEIRSESFTDPRRIAAQSKVVTWENAERWRQAEDDMERMKRGVTALQSENKAPGKSVANIEDGLDAFKTRIGATANDISRLQEMQAETVSSVAAAAASAAAAALRPIDDETLLQRLDERLTDSEAALRAMLLAHDHALLGPQFPASPRHPLPEPLGLEHAGHIQEHLGPKLPASPLHPIPLGL